jgi:hypothetical protein
LDGDYRLALNGKMPFEPPRLRARRASDKQRDQNRTANPEIYCQTCPAFH